ncbi:hypothetical protein ACFQ1L_35985 [Phytohabitans flavus]|uniref:hypothetical protein n=1 Tax=Phytohabitans flavus TaxID=1076124 RepID=UPI00363F683F
MTTRSAATAANSAVVQVRPANAGEVDRIARVVLNASVDTVDSAWLVDDRPDRLAMFAIVWPAVADYALAHGRVDVAIDAPGVVVGAAIWLPSAVRDLDAERQLLARAGRYADRFRRYQDLLIAQQQTVPTGWQLITVAVQHGRRSQGVGSALLRYRHVVLDRYGLPAYVAAAAASLRNLARRHGYQPASDAVLLPDGGPALWPMARQPAPPGTEPGTDAGPHPLPDDRTDAPHPGHEPTPGSRQRAWLAAPRPSRGGRL